MGSVVTSQQIRPQKWAYWMAIVLGTLAGFSVFWFWQYALESPKPDSTIFSLAVLCGAAFWIMSFVPISSELIRKYSGKPDTPFRKFLKRLGRVKFSLLYLLTLPVDILIFWILCLILVSEPISAYDTAIMFHFTYVGAASVGFLYGSQTLKSVEGKTVFKLMIPFLWLGTLLNMLVYAITN